MAQISMTIGQRCKLCNQMPTYGDLEAMLESKSIRGALIENFSTTQMEAYKISKNGLGQYEADETTKDTPTMVTFDNVALASIKKFISNISEKNHVFVDDANLFQRIMNLE